MHISPSEFADFFLVLLENLMCYMQLWTTRDISVTIEQGVYQHTFFPHNISVNVGIYPGFIV